jgi:putative ABC transport system permease protein
MINALLAQRYFSGENPIGKRFHFGHRPVNDPREWITITGVVGDTRLYGLANPSRLEVYIPFRQSITGDMNLIAKSRNDPAALTAAIRHVVHSLDKDLPISGIATMEQLISNSVSTRRVTLILLGMFSALALVLAAIGIYGVISYSVAQRTHEIGIRMALGAQRRDVLRMVLTQGAKIAGAGMIIGIVLSFGLARLIANLLFSVSAADPLTFAAVAIVLALVAMLACYIPARRALRVDPMVALRHE